MSGEASGDDYGARLFHAMREQDPTCIVRGMGGPKMQAAGVDCFIDSTELGVVGFIEVFRQLPLFIRLLKHAERLAAETRPDVVVMIDYPGFNLRLAKKLHRMGIKVVWYISPQVWAWKRKRIFTLEKCVDKLLCILPFEPKYYAPTKLPVEFVGHPLLQTLAPYRAIQNQRDDNLVLLLPGSRQGELLRLLPHFLRAALIMHRQNPKLKFVISLPRESTLQLAQKILKDANLPADAPEFQLSYGNTRDLMTKASAAIATCGTVILEAALLGLPTVVAYRMNPITWFLAKLIVKLPYVSLPSLICGRLVFEELLQGNCTAANLAATAQKILPGGSDHEKALEGIRDTIRNLGDESDVAGRVAQICASMK